MVYPKSLIIAIQKVKLNERTWVDVSQGLLGLFFIGAGFFKLNNYFFLDASLGSHLQYWIDSGWMPDWYAALSVQIAQPHERLIAGLVTGSHLVGGFLLMINVWTRWAALVILLLQINIFIGTIGHTNFNEFVGISVWVALLFTLRPTDPAKWNKWVWLTLRCAFVGFCLLQIKNRYHYQDAWLESFIWQRNHLAQDVMSITVPVKHFILWLTSFAFMKYVWVSTWWIRIIFTVGLLTKWRVFCGSMLLMLWMGSELIWNNAVTSHGMLWILVLFVYVSQELLLQQNKLKKSTS